MILLRLLSHPGNLFYKKNNYSWILMIGKIIKTNNIITISLEFPWGGLNKSALDLSLGSKSLWVEDKKWGYLEDFCFIDSILICE